MKINIHGNLFGIDGYSNHTRQLFNALYELNPDIKLEVSLPQDWMRQVNDAELNAITKEQRKADVTISISQPQFWRLSMDNCEKFVGFLVFEGDKIPKYWLDYLMDERVSQIWVPSQHTKDAIVNTIQECTLIENCPYLSEKYHKQTKDRLLEKIKVVPHGVNLNIFKPQEVKRNDKFTFICNKGWRGGMEDRGGVGYVLKAYCEEFSKDENVCLLLKLNPTYLNPQLLKQKIDELKLPEDRPEIKINIDNMPYKKLPELYCQGDVYVCAQRADAFNICGLEAMGCGLPTIQTDFGGQTDYADDGNGWLIPTATIVSVQNDIVYEGVCWAIPSVVELKKIMRESFTNKDVTKEKGQQALKDVQYWTWHNSAKKAMEFLREIN